MTRFSAVCLFAVCIVMGACGGGDDSGDFDLGGLANVTVTVRADGEVEVSAAEGWPGPTGTGPSPSGPQRANLWSGLLYIQMVNQTPETQTLRVVFGEGAKEPKLFGLAPGETRLEDVDLDYGAFEVEWTGSDLLLTEVEPLPTVTNTPRPDDGCPYAGDAQKGYGEGFALGFFLDWEVRRLQEEPALGFYITRYGEGYREGYSSGLGAAHFAREKATPRDYADYDVDYQRGLIAGLDDGYGRMTDEALSSEYRDHFYEGYFDAITDEEALCEFQTFPDRP